jgi:hypothetical protein
VGRVSVLIALSVEWSLHEQVIEAALECGNVSLSQALLQALLRRFPDSSRVQALKVALLAAHHGTWGCDPEHHGTQGMHFEACGNYEAAEDVYNQLLKQPAGATIGLKRLVSAPCPPSSRPCQPSQH